MRINLLCIGKTNQKLVQEQIKYYIERLPKHWNTQIIEIPDPKNTKNLAPEQIKKEEGKIILQQIEHTDLVILLDEKGKQYTSKEFAQKIENWQNTATKKIYIVIGGAWGFSDEVYKRANEKISLSKMTFTHQMIRLFITEQIYRASQIIQGKPYHND